MKKTDDDIIVYKFIKVCGKKLFTPYYGVKIKIGKTYHSEIVINNGYVNLPFKYCGNILIETQTQDYINVGLHSFKNYEDALNVSNNYVVNWNKKGIIVKCIIPKNSIYYDGIFDDGMYINNLPSIVSNTIKYVEILN